jgi:hypothetical protein
LNSSVLTDSSPTDIIVGDEGLQEKNNPVNAEIRIKLLVIVLDLLPKYKFTKK